MSRVDSGNRFGISSTSMNTERPLLSVIIPILNEAATIRTIIDRVQAVPVDKEILIVNDGSTDGTAGVIDAMSDPNIRVFHHPQNRGKGAAIRTAIPHIRGRFAVIQDGDLEYDPQDFLKMLDVVQSRNGRAIFGSRILSHSRMSYLRYWIGGRGVTFFTNLFFGSRLTDEPTCYKMIESDLLKSLDLRTDGFEFCPEVTAKLLNRHIEILEVPITYAPRSIEEGKKIRWKDGVIALWVLLKLRLTGR
mgnify:FL=1